MKKKRSFSVNVGTSLVLMAVGTALLSFGGLLQAQTQTYYTEFDFTGGVTVSDYMAHITNTGGVVGNIQVALTNREKTDISVAFDVVDAVQIDGGVWACQDRYIEDSTGFARGFREQGASIPSSDTLSSGESQTYTFTYNFPRYYSGNYMGCVLYYERDAERDVNTVSRKALLVSANVASSEITYTVKVYPISREETDFSDSGMVRVYSVSGNTWTEVQSGHVDIGAGGTGSVPFILEPGIYNVVYKSWYSLASYLSGFSIDGSVQTFDFTTGDNLIGVQSVALGEDNGFGYQKGGDYIDIMGDVDGQINGADASIVSLLIEWCKNNIVEYGMTGRLDCPRNLIDSTHIIPLSIGDAFFDQYDLDGNNVINAAELTIINRNLGNIETNSDVFYKNGSHYPSQLGWDSITVD